MRVAVIGWGSLIWNPGKLKIVPGWHRDGPSLPVEYSRVSKDGRLTLVIVPGVDRVRRVTTLWALSELGSLEKAREDLRRREDTPNIRNIGMVTPNTADPDEIQRLIMDWMTRVPVDAAVWTALPSKRPDKTKALITADEACDYIRKLSGEKARKAEEYVRNTPEQIETETRTRLRDIFRWENNPLPPDLFARPI